MSCSALAQRRHADRHDAQAIEEILAERARGDQLVEPPVGGRDDAHRDANRLLAADALQLAVLQDAQQLGLRRLVQVADLVEKDRAAVGQLELAAPQRRRAGERALLVAEQLALDQLGRNGGAVDLDERPGRERALAVDVRRQQLLARPRLARRAARRRPIARPAWPARRRAGTPRSARSSSARRRPARGSAGSRAAGRTARARSSRRAARGRARAASRESRTRRCASRPPRRGSSPCPEIITTGVASSLCLSERSTSMPLPSGRRTSSR